jgi:hypothetical protein
MSQVTIIPEEYRSEFSVDSEGKVGIGRRALARIINVKHSTIIRWLKSDQGWCAADELGISKVHLEGISSRSLAIPDILASRIIEHYAFDAGRNCKEQAIKVYRAFAAIGIRTFFQQQLGWQPPEPAIESEGVNYEEEISNLNEMVICLCERLERVERKTTSNTEDLKRLDCNQDLLEEKYEQTIKDKEYKRKISLLIAKHCGDNEGFRRASWNGIYGELIRQTEFQVYSSAKLWNCSCIDAVEIGGYMSKLYAIASEVLV